LIRNRPAVIQLDLRHALDALDRGKDPTAILKDCLWHAHVVVFDIERSGRDNDPEEQRRAA